MNGDADELELMTEEQRHGEQKTNWGLFVALHASPFLVLFLSSIGILSDAIAAVAVLALSIAAFYMTKTKFGWELVGIKWIIDKEKQPDFPFITFSAKSLPFVASAFNSNTFWLTMLFSTVGMILATIKYLLNSNQVLGIALVIVSTMNVVNSNFFVRCHNVAKQQADKQARNVLLDATAEFEHVDDSDVQDDPEKPVEKKPEETHSSIQTPSVQIGTPKQSIPAAPSPIATSEAVKIVPQQPFNPSFGQEPEKEVKVLVPSLGNKQPTFKPTFGDVPMMDDAPTFEPPKAEDAQMPVFEDEASDDTPAFNPSFNPSFDDNANDDQKEEDVMFGNADEGSDNGSIHTDNE